MGRGGCCISYTQKRVLFLNPLVFSAYIFRVKNSGENGRKKLVGLLADVALKTYLCSITYTSFSTILKSI